MLLERVLISNQYYRPHIQEPPDISPTLDESEIQMRVNMLSVSVGEGRSRAPFQKTSLRRATVIHCISRKAREGYMIVAMSPIGAAVAGLALVHASQRLIDQQQEAT